MKYIILSSDACIKCEMAKKLFMREQISYDVIDAFSDKGQELAEKFDIEQIPAFFNENEEFLGFDPVRIAGLK